MRGIYIFTSRDTGKKYIGKAVNLDKRIKKHWLLAKNGSEESPAFYRALRKYPSADQWNIEKIEYPGSSDEALCAIEKWHIAKNDSFKNGYNLTPGGDGAGSGADHHFYGKKRPELSERMTGKKTSEETREKMSAAHKGKIVSEDTRKKMSAAQKGNQNGKGNKGRTGQFKINKSAPGQMKLFK